MFYPYPDDERYISQAAVSPFSRNLTYVGSRERGCTALGPVVSPFVDTSPPEPMYESLYKARASEELIGRSWNKEKDVHSN